MAFNAAKYNKYSEEELRILAMGTRLLLTALAFRPVRPLLRAAYEAAKLHREMHGPV